MKAKFLFLLIFNIFLWNNARTQGYLNAFIDKSHFESWATQQHRDICKMLFTDLISGKLQGYNADRGQLSRDQMSLMLENVVTYDTFEGIKDPVKTIDATIQNFDFFETILFTGDMIHRHSVNTVSGISTDYYKQTGSSSPHIIDFHVQSGAFENLLNTAQKQYVSFFRRDSLLAATAISKISTELFTEIFSKLFHESFSPATGIYTNVELTDPVKPGSRKNINLTEVVRSLPFNTESTDQYDTVFMMHITPEDRFETQKIAISMTVQQLHFDVTAIGCSFSSIRTATGAMGFLNYKTGSGLELQEKALIEFVICKHLIDGLIHDK